MNKTYRSVWNETTGTWVAVSEQSVARGKQKNSRLRSFRILATIGVGTVGGMVSSSVFASQLCTTDVNGGNQEAMSAASKSLIQGCQGLPVTGHDIGMLEAQSSMVYVDGTTGTVNFRATASGPTLTINSAGNLKNLTAGVVNGSSKDAINGSQLFGLASSVATDLGGGVSANADGSVTAPKYVVAGGTYSNVGSALAALSAGGKQDAVLYDSSAHSSVSLGGASATAPVALLNVANGAVNASSTDAVNGAQLYGVSSSITSINSDVTRIHNTLTTAGWGAQSASSNPAAYPFGGFIMDADGNVSNPAVLYTPNTTGTANAQIVLDPGKGNSLYFVNGDRSQGYLPKGTIISNVADGIQDTDAANVGQVYEIVSSSSGGSKDRLLLSASTANNANGGSGVNSTGLNQSYTTAAYYAQVAGLADNSGSQGPSDAARASGAGAIAIGSNAYTHAANGVALGVQAYASAKDGVAIGAGSVANESNTVSVGNDGKSSYVAYDANGVPFTIQNEANTRRIVNLAAGQDDTDAVNVSQLRSVASALGGGAGINAAGGFIAPSYMVGGATVNNVGDAITNLDNRVLKNTADISTLAASMNPAAATSATSSGTERGAVAIGSLAPANPISVGVGGVGDTSTTDSNAVHYDSADHSTVTLGGTSGGNVSLSGLQNGTLSAQSTDAVTGQQLYATNEQVANINQAVQNLSTAGSTAISVNSTSNAASASGTQSVAVGGGAVATGSNATAIGDTANASATNSVALGANSVANRDNSVSVGAAGSERQIVNVAAGTQGTDAVNLNQLNTAIAQQSSAIGQQISNLQGSINTVSKNAYAGVAAAMAMPNLTPSGPGRTVVAAGGGYYMGGSAAAVGVTYRSANMHWLMSGAVSVTSTGNPGVRAQVGYEF